MNEIDQKNVNKVTDAADSQCGERDGRRWALRKATVPELSMLAALAPEYEVMDDDSEDPARFLNGWVGANVAGAFGADVKGGRAIIKIEASKCSKEYVQHFVRAAAQAWRECLEQLS